MFLLEFSFIPAAYVAVGGWWNPDFPNHQEKRKSEKIGGKRMFVPVTGRLEKNGQFDKSIRYNFEISPYEAPSTLRRRNLKTKVTRAL